MLIPGFIRDVASMTLKTIDMHTCGEPTRVVYEGFPDLQGTLLEQRAAALEHHDHIRKALIHEPRGHHEMYGAALRLKTELTRNAGGEADIGVLFLTNEGYSTMCGHATIALGRLIVDHVGSGSTELFSTDQIKLREHTSEESGLTVTFNLHAPCGLVQVIVPVCPLQGESSSKERFKTDLSRQISYFSVPSFATGIRISLSVPRNDEYRWPELGNAHSRTVYVSYGGAFYIIVPVTELGFDEDALYIRDRDQFQRLAYAAHKLRNAFLNSSDNQGIKKTCLSHPQHRELEHLYGVIVTGRSHRKEVVERDDGQAICFFADQQVDRSPTGSGVQARVALAHANGIMNTGDRRIFHSTVSNSFDGQGALIGEVAEEVDAGGGKQGVVVKISGSAGYTSCSTFVLEDEDEIGQGFVFETLGNRARSR